MQDTAIKRLQQAVTAIGGAIVEQDGGYLRAVFASGRSEDTLEFLFAENDNTVTMRAVSNQDSFFQNRSNAKRLEGIRVGLQWDNVFILRNRKRLFGVVESPFDSFGPTPPVGSDYDSAQYDAF